MERLTMATIKEDYVSFECAKLLKEKGFDEEVTSFYFLNGLLSHGNTYAHCKMAVSSNSDLILAPTLQMAMRWLREKYNLFIQIEFDPPIFSTDIFKMNEIDEYGGAKHISPTFANAKSYESACEAAIKYCLENLI